MLSLFGLALTAPPLSVAKNRRRQFPHTRATTYSTGWVYHCIPETNGLKKVVRSAAVAAVGTVVNGEQRELFSKRCENPPTGDPE